MIGTWGRCPHCNYIWDMYDTKCVLCKHPLEDHRPVTKQRASISQAQIGIYTNKIGSTSGPIPTYEFHLTAFRDPMSKFVKDTGESEAVQEWIKVDPRVAPIIHQCLLLAADHIDAGHSNWLTIGFRDVHEKWISRAVANLVADALAAEQYKVAVVYGL